MLKIDGITVFYGELKALDDISMEIKEGEFVALVGNNGAGKTTLLNTIMGLLHPSAGEINFCGEKINTYEPHQIVDRKLSLVPESKWVFPQMTVYENLVMGAYPKKCRGRYSENLDRVYSIFPRLHERKNQLAKTLSGGELQMLIIGRGLMSEPKLLMVDELSAGLSPKLSKESFELLGRLHRDQKITILLAEQNVYETLKLADRGIVMENGRLVLAGSGQELINSDQIRQKYLGM
ncbi:MAG: ABC transporter ATP-binding protein [Desulfocucumaceae bacterium]